MQHARTAEAVGRLCEVVSTAELDVSAPDFDLVHIFNAADPCETFRRIQIARSADKPIALSTIWWSMEELYLEWASRGWRHEAPQRECWEGRCRQMAPIFHEPDLLLPNSHAEYGVLVGQFGTTKPYRAVPNAVDPAFADLAGEDTGARDFLLCVGRMELRKNQLGLLEGLQDDCRPIVFVGDENPEDREHAQACRDLAQARGNVAFMSAISDRKALAELMRSCAAYVQPSLYETPGLAALEAALCGAPVVVSDRGCTREYFGDLAEYCNPTSRRSIRSAIERALAAPRDGRLARHVRENFNWDRAAGETVAAYQSVL